jgi:trimethylamine--corrinoid protein Co-methyltransferase
MRVNLSQPAGVHFRVLSDDQCEQIWLAALEVLERVGARFYEGEALALLKKAGCAVSDETRVQFPAAVIRRALQTVPARFTLYARTGEPAIRVEPHRPHFGPGPTCPNFLDPFTGRRRPFVKNDAALTARVCDALANIDYVMSLGSINDVPPGTADIHEFDAMVRETTKPIMSWSFDLESLIKIHRMGVAVKGSAAACAREPFMIFYAEPSSPLKHTAEALQKLIYCARQRIPLVYTPCPIGGGTAPATLAGVLVQSLAEALGGVTLAQLIQPGAPVVIGGVVSILDMRTTILAYGAPELGLMSAAATEVAQYLGLPMFSTAGCTDSKCQDAQAAIEAAMSILPAALSGANFIHDVGFIESAMTGSLEQLVMSDEIIGMARFIARGIRVDAGALAVNAIAQAAETGNFLDLEHTAENFREQFWFPTLMDRFRHGEWAEQGRRSMGDRVGARVRELLAGRRAPPLAQPVARAMDDIIGQ